MKSEHRITVLLADDHRIVREGFRSLLMNENDIEVIGEAANGPEALELTRELRPDVVVMDISMPQVNGLEATRQIVKAVPGVKVIILSAHSDDAYVEKALEVGASGYLIKQSSALFLSESIRKVWRGDRVFSSSVARHFAKRLQGLPSQKDLSQTQAPRLSSRETEVLQMTAEGLHNKQIASALGISAKTSEKHRYRLMQKLDIHDTAGLTRYAITTGVIEAALVCG